MDLYLRSAYSASSKCYFIQKFSGLRVLFRVFYCGTYISSQIDQETTAEQPVVQVL